MRVFGSDIGCKNLAYCIFNEKDGKIEIEHWDLVDLRDCICGKKMRGGKICNKTASWEYEDDEGRIRKVCSSHKCSGCKRIKFGENDNLNVYAEKMKEYFDKINITCDKYGLENQPTLKNPKMKSIQMILFSYLSFYKTNKAEINLIHPKMKLSLIDEITKNIIKSSPKNKQYKITKQLGIIITQYILDHEVVNKDKWIDTFKDKSKQDDLCDAFLHGYYLLYGKNCKIEDKDFIDYVKKEIEYDKIIGNKTKLKNDKKEKVEKEKVEKVVKKRSKKIVDGEVDNEEF